MAKTVRIRAKEAGGVTEVKALLKHDMAVGQDGKDGHYITEVTGQVGDKVVFNMLMGSAVSKDPYINFKTSAVKKGDEIVIKWVDNKGESDEGSAKVK